MKSKAFSTVIPTISVILFVIAITHLVAGIVKEMGGAANAQKARFESIFSVAKDAAKSKESKDSFMQKFEESIGNIADFGSLKLSVNDVMVYDFVAKNPPAKTREIHSSEPTENGTVSLSAKISNASNGTIHKHARLAFFLVLAGTVLSLVNLFLNPSEQTSKDDDEEKSTEESEQNVENSEKEIIEHDENNETEASDEIDEDFFEKNEGDNTLKNSEDEIEESEDSEDFEDEIEEEIFNEEIEKSDVEEDETVVVTNDNSAEISQEISFRQDLDEKLRENEYKEISLTLVRVKTDDANKQEVAINAIENHFEKKIELYKFDENTIAVVQNGVDLEKSIMACEELLPTLENLVGEGNAFLGLSAMSYRAIPAERLIVEAEGALARAESDPNSPIVAFKANPDRYKQKIGNEVEEEKTETQETSDTKEK